MSFKLTYINALGVNNNGIGVELGVGELIQLQLVFGGFSTAMIR